VKPGWLLGLMLAQACVTQAASHELDSANTHVSFDIERLGLRWFSVEFRELQGEFAPAPDGQGAHLTVVVRTASIDARSAYWNERLRSSQWLDTEHFPEMVFRSTSIRFEGDAQATVQGELTLHGITRPLTLTISDIDCPQSTPATCRFHGRASLRRSEFGIPHGFWLGGDRVQILVRGE
jgi:polyisoprenoid-binding protein YceI